MFPNLETLTLEIEAAWTERGLRPQEGLAQQLAQGLLDRAAQREEDGPWLCQEVLALVPLGQQAPAEGWLALAYRYIQGKMFPDAPCFTQNTQEFGPDLERFLSVLQLVFLWEGQSRPFHPFVQFQLLSQEEYAPCDCGAVYGKFLSYYHQEYVYELMRLGEETTPYKALGHMGGVHHVAMTVARGLKQGGIPIDLALVSGAAMSHDFGKFGCRPGERVPYLHYYYTDHWLSTRGMEAIAHIAANHSTWDLELEALSAEALCLIYADFRSKQYRDENGQEVTKIFSLADSFDVIFDKLDHVDGEKKRRYQLVYEKLRTFEDYLCQLGVDIFLTGAEQIPEPVVDPVLLSPDQSIRALSLMSVEHSLKLMHLLSSQHQFGDLIESARSAKNWKQLRAYLDIFRAYFIYLSVAQKRQALALLYQLLIHREGDIRRQASSLMGQMIAKFHLVYRKELPAHVERDPAEEVPFALWKDYFRQILYPDHRTTATQRGHISFTLKLVVESLLHHGRKEDLPRFVQEMLRYFHQETPLDPETALTLMDALTSVPGQYYQEFQEELIHKTDYFLQMGQVHLTTAVLEFYLQQDLAPEDPLFLRILALTEGVEDFCLPVLGLKCRILARGGRDVSALDKQLAQVSVVGEVFLDNLKTATPWGVKVAGIQLLQSQKNQQSLHIATHFSNLLKTSERVVVRHVAGEALVDLLPRLTRDQRNEVVVELGKGLEMGQLELSKYIPQYLGAAILFLHPTELDEQVAWLQGFLGAPSDGPIAGALNTTGELLQHYPKYPSRFPQEGDREEGRARYQARRLELLGILLQGLAHYREGVRQEALLVLGKLLDSPLLSLEEKAELFAIAYRKILFLLREGQRGEEPLTFFFRASALGSIKGFLAQYQLEQGGFHIQRPPKVAFFPGTFDPFTLSHKEIAKSIRALGFEVYLAVDEFSWSKKAQPHLVRRQVVNLSIAGEFHVHLFPFDMPVNIANPRDLKKLSALFPEEEVYLVVGSDVVEHASSYQKAPEPHSIHQCNHIIFRRAGETDPGFPITGKVIELQLPPHLEDISSTRIRENVDLNRDISSFIDPVVQDYIYQNGLYLRDFQNKQLVEIPELYFQWMPQPSAQDVHWLVHSLNPRETDPVPEEHRPLLILKNWEGKVLGFANYGYYQVEELFSVFQDVALVKGLRLRSAGKTLLISSLYGVEGERDYPKLLLTEIMAQACQENCVYGVYRPQGGQISQKEEDLFARSGFLSQQKECPLLEVNMRTPTVVIQNLETAIQEPLSKNPRVLEAIAQGHHRLQEALTQLYPGNLVLSLSADIINQRLLEKITAHHGVPVKPVTPRKLGDCMCVPYGKLLRGKIVPNTVTKAVHTDRVFSTDLSEHRVEAYPNYTPIPCQVRTIRSFDRPVILVDDLMHSGLRIGALDGILYQEEVDLSLVLVGVLTGHGRDVMSSLNRPVDSVYFLPLLERWFVESTLYPFIGGDTVEREKMPLPGLLPGINHLLPYHAPVFQRDSSPQDLYHFSLSCLESASQLLHVLEEEYRLLYGRNLTLSRLPEAVILPLCPDKGAHLSYDPSLAPSVYVDNDLELLRRTAPK